MIALSPTSGSAHRRRRNMAPRGYCIVLHLRAESHVDSNERAGPQGAWKQPGGRSGGRPHGKGTISEPRWCGGRHAIPVDRPAVSAYPSRVADREAEISAAQNVPEMAPTASSVLHGLIVGMMRPEVNSQSLVLKFGNFGCENNQPTRFSLKLVKRVGGWSEG